MASASFAPDLARYRRISLAEIDAAVSARLGATRGLGNSQPVCFNRQVAMYLAKPVGGWTTTVIGRFDNGQVIKNVFAKTVENRQHCTPGTRGPS